MRGKATYRPDIDGLRGVAILAVIANHFNEDFLPSGFLGVDIFFVISGFVITGSILSHSAANSREFFVDFYRRRVQRLIPAAILFVVVTAVLTCLFVPDPKESLLTGLYSLVGGSNFFLYFQSTDYFGGDALLNSFTHTWSLGVEEQFYIVFPVIIWLVVFAPAQSTSSGPHGPGLRRLQWLLIAFLIASLWLYLAYSQSDPSAAYYLPLPRLWEIAAGCLLYVILHRRPHLRRVATKFLPGGIILAAIVALWLAPIEWIAITTPLTVLATCALSAGIRPAGRTFWFLTRPWLLRTGLISYSLYLWHWTVLALSRWTIGISPWTVPLQLLAMFLLAEASFRFLETPLRRRTWAPHKWQTISLGLGVNGLIAATMALLTLDGIGSGLYAGERTATLSQQRNLQKIEGTSINNGVCLLPRREELNPREFDEHVEICSAEPAGERPSVEGRIFIVGDSHASSLLPLGRVLFEEGHPITQLTKSGCPFPLIGISHVEPSCNSFMDQALDHILETSRPGDAVIISAYYTALLKSGVRDSRDSFLDKEGVEIKDTNEKIGAYSAAVNRFAARARDQGLRVLLIGAGPRLYDRERCLPEWFRPAHGLEECRKGLEKEQEIASRLNRRLRKNLSNDVVFLDPIEILCPEECSLNDMRNLLFDQDHLADRAVRQFHQPVRGALR